MEFNEEEVRKNAKKNPKVCGTFTTIDKERYLIKDVKVATINLREVKKNG